MNFFEPNEWTILKKNEFQLLPNDSKRSHLILHKGQELFIPRSLSLLCKDGSMKIQKWFWDKKE